MPAGRTTPPASPASSVPGGCTPSAFVSTVHSHPISTPPSGGPLSHLPMSAGHQNHDTSYKRTQQSMAGSQPHRFTAAHVTNTPPGSAVTPGTSAALASYHAILGQISPNVLTPSSAAELAELSRLTSMQGSPLLTSAAAAVGSSQKLTSSSAQQTVAEIKRKIDKLKSQLEARMQNQTEGDRSKHTAAIARLEKVVADIEEKQVGADDGMFDVHGTHCFV
eukprot:jgi/Chrzof1/11067/Cz05g22080.t1